MKKKYLAVILLTMFLGIIEPKALTVNDCKVLVSFKLSSSLDEEKYICKGIDYGNSTDSIYYTSSDNIIHFNSFSAYYFYDWNEYDITIDMSGQNTISLLQVGNSKIKVTGNGSLKFKQNSYVKKVINGEPIYRYVFNDKIVLSQDKKIYEGTTLEFAENYELLKNNNTNMPTEYDLEKYELVSAIDYTKMTSVVITENWLSKHIDTPLKKFVSDGYGIIEYVSENTQSVEEKNNSETNQLETDNVILISDEKLKTQYELKETNLKEEQVATKVSSKIKEELISLYDVNVYNKGSEVSMKNGKYTIKIKLDNNLEDYENYQIIYVNDKGEIEEYLNGYIENEYIVFETTHLSQYGVIATPKSESIIVKINGQKSLLSNIKLGNILKISILLIIPIGTIILITIILLKSNLLNNKKIKTQQK